MTPSTEQERAAYERELIDKHNYVPADFTYHAPTNTYGGGDDFIQFGWDLWQAARRAPAANQEQAEMVKALRNFASTRMDELAFKALRGESQ